MERFLKRYEDRIIGIISGFDRILIRGTLRSISYSKGMDKFLGSHQVLYTKYGEFVEMQSEELKKHAKEIAANAGRTYQYLASPKQSKEELAKAIAEKESIQEGLICVLASVEQCQSFGLRKDKASAKVRLITQTRQCQHLYFYYLDREFGFMHIRLQTWFPFNIQVYINGREYLARQMDKTGIGYEQRDNCFSWIEDVGKAQKLIKKLETRKWENVLKAFAERINPLVKKLNLKPYYWSIAQSEYATDIMFENDESLAQVYPALVRHSSEQFSSKDVLKFFERRTNVRFAGEVKTSRKERRDGVRVKHCLESNSIKMYDKQGSVLRIETTINNPRQLKTYRSVMRKGKQVTQWVRMRKGICDIERLVTIALAANERYLQALAVVGEIKPASQLLDCVSQPKQVQGRTYRALKPIAPQDAAIFALIMRGEFNIQGVRNKDITMATAHTAKPLSSPQVSRLLRLFRAHGLIFKVHTTNYYRITKLGHEIMSTALKFRQSDISLLVA